MGFQSKAHCFNETALICKRLDSLLGDKATLYGGKLTSLDVLAFAYLKTLLVNASQSKEVEMVLKSYPKLVNFVERLAGPSLDEVLPEVAQVKEPIEWLETHFK